ncbi:glomulin-like [Nelusetta ayraudi]|uniref:glomulin-like n=1 Tax=Nelusetta ayraudi TaxID=303726 RepID=UPI003F709580
MDEDQVKDIIQRWRDTAEEDLKPEDYQLFQGLASVCLTRGDVARLQEFLQDRANAPMVRTMGCVLVAPLLTEALKRERSMDRCQATLTYLSRTCHPEELLRSLLELIKDIQPGRISETILAALPLLQTALPRLQAGSRAAAVGSALSAVQEQLSRLPVPYSRQQEEADELGLCRCCGALANFTKPFVEEVAATASGRTGGERLASPEQEELRAELVKFCMRSLRDPLLEAELRENGQSPLWVFAEEIMATLAAIQESLPGLLFFNSVRRSRQSEDSQSREPRACLAYLLFVQLIAMESFPAVFSPVFVLQCNMDHANQLLSSKKESHLLKGLALFTKSLDNVQDNSLPAGLLDLRSFFCLPQNLRLVLTECPMQHLRESGLKALQQFINKLDMEAKHKFFRCMLKTSNHAGVEGFIVKNIRNQVEISLQPGNANTWFLGEGLVSLLGLLLCLPHGAETDLLNGMDRVMESLSLLRYLILRDKELKDQATVWHELCRIKDEYLKILRVSISMSRTYYSGELKSLREGQKLKAAEAREALKSARLVKGLKVKRENVSSLSPEVQHQVLQSALVTFDLMESLVARIEEISEERQRLSV